METQRHHLLVLLIMAVSGFHATCTGFPMSPIMLPLPTLPSPSTEGTSAPTIATTTTPPTVSQGSEASEEHGPTLPPFIDITRTTESSPDEHTSSPSDTVAFQVELIMDIVIPTVVKKVKLGHYTVKHPGQFAIGSGLDMINGVFKVPCQGIYYFSASVHIKQFPSDTKNLTGSLGVGVCTNNRCTAGSLQEASLSATVPFQMDGFNTQASGFLQLEEDQLVTVLLESTCSTDFTIKSSSSLSIFKLM